jgi:hypothetical protein
LDPPLARLRIIQAKRLDYITMAETSDHPLRFRMGWAAATSRAGCTTGDA